MLTSIIDRQVRESVVEYLKATFPTTTPLFENMFSEFLQTEGMIFKGPFISLGLPFRKGNCNADFFQDIPLKFAPYAHQERAFNRLKKEVGKSTIVATGTGSGKTECFLVPILDYCLQKVRSGQKGVKAILIYPMNALATDQALRLAKMINTNPNLKGIISAGLYVGQQQEKPHAVMGPDHIITDKEILRNTPPDILLTNYRMLDYMLDRPQDKNIWQHNRPGILKYLAVDELHTFDGAQGTDLACLIRRLKARLGITPGTLTCVGTSATLGSGEDATAKLLDYASQIFGEPFDHESVIQEERLSAKEFLEGSFLEYSLPIPTPKSLSLMDIHTFKTIDSYICQQIKLWFREEIIPEPFEAVQWRKTLGEKLKSHIVFRTLLEELQREIRDLKSINDRFRSLFREFAINSDLYRQSLIDSLFSLISIARDRNGLPFLNLRFQSWLRELRRMVVSVSRTPVLRFSDELSPEIANTSLPAVHCRNCGAIGWTGIKKKNRTKLETELSSFYSSFFAHYPSPDITFLFPSSDELTEGAQKGQYKKICTECLELLDVKELECSECNSKELLPVFIPLSIAKRQNGDLYTKRDCPVCKEKDALIIIGAQAASLSSVMINQLFASPYNDDKKLITFSDNVQDAAHRSGYFGARTWRFNFRTALMRFFSSLPEGTTLYDAHQQFSKYEIIHLKDPATFVSLFTPRNMMWMYEYSHMVEYENTDFSDGFLSMLHKRLGWEIYSEMSLEARRGRTLERAGCAVLVPLLPKNEPLKILYERLCNRIEWFRNCSIDLLLKSLLGIIKHCIYNGAIYHQELDSYISQLGNRFLISSAFKNAVRPWMPEYSRVAKLPAFISTKQGKDNHFELLKRETTHGTSWFGEWYYKCFDSVYPLINDYFGDFYEEVFKFLVEEKLFFSQKVEYDSATVWGLTPDKLIIETSTVQLCCNKCHHTISTGKSESDLWVGTRCLKGGCRGTYAFFDQQLSYYGSMYLNGDTVRLFPHEHTGLLDRDTREKVEIEFKASDKARKPWYPNLLSCTPTLEMGIDIGDLSSVLLCSVPPEQASYLQRIGRAGRTDGNSSCITVANGTPHDLYFYAAPHEMYSGNVKVPGVFLDASAVLERQLTAYCLDCFIYEKGIDRIPFTVFDIIRKFHQSGYRDFPKNFFIFVQDNWERLYSNFISLFSTLLSSDACVKLKNFIDPSNGQSELENRIVNGLQQLIQEQTFLEQRRKKISVEISKLRNDPGHDPEILEGLEKEKSALNSLIKKIRDKKTYHYMTDEGLLPNYAFPEEGIQLKSVIYRKNNNDDDNKYSTTDYSYERAAASALSDFAPGNTFYANGRQVKIDQIDIRGSEREMWRFCPHCSFMQRLAEEGDTKKQCPSCGSTYWGESTQKIELLKVHQVLATTSERESLITDASENREVKFFVKEMFVNFNNDQITGAWQLDNDYFPFGFEFIRKTDFREVNFGDRAYAGDDKEINGKRIPVAGFAICKECGKVQERYADEPQHTFFCRQKNKDTNESIISVLHLYREFTSESVRFLIPAASDFSKQQMESFLAALHLGLKDYFKGDISHLQLTVMTEPIEGSKQKKSYVVLYDTVPGGTGYIGQLSHKPSLIFDVLRESLNHLLTCTCSRIPDSDGCYRCLYRYKNANVMELISRREAIKLLQDILKYEDRLKQVSSLSSISMNPVLESELERFFIDALQKRISGSGTLQFKPVTINGKTGYRIIGKDYTWQLEPQVELGSTQGILIQSRADFLLTEINGRMKKPVAIFTDGWQYHEKRVSQDMAQRMALLFSGTYHFWSITWKDVEDFIKGVDHLPTSFLSDLITDNSIYRKLQDSLQLKSFENLHNLNSLALLFKFLQQPDSYLWASYAVLIQTYAAYMKKSSKDVWNSSVQENLPNTISDHWTISNSGFGDFQKETIRFQTSLGKMITDINPFDHRNILTLQKVDNTLNEESWRQWLQIANIIQFVPFSFFAIEGERLQSQYLQINPSIFSKESVDITPEWMEIFEQVKYSGDDILALVKKLEKELEKIPEVSYELVNIDGEIIAEAELAWENEKVAILVDDTCQECFKRAGWNVFVLPEIDFEHLIQIIRMEDTYECQTSHS
ncbi:MAG TPA: DEAD/DEAH box helicase [Chitinispirillaceae bacterium]|nr:DEAD/DEAH box helicase [Chitinispirillaceae bacterium]